MTWLKSKIESIRDNDLMPTRICAAGSAILPPIGVAILVGLALGAVYLGRQVYERLNPPPETQIVCARFADGSSRCWTETLVDLGSTAHSKIERILEKWAPPVIMVLMGGAIWIIFGLLSYIHCHRFWHGEKPEWAKSEEEKFDEYLDCPECEEEVGQCLHWGTTP